MIEPNTDVHISPKNTILQPPASHAGHRTMSARIPIHGPRAVSGAHHADPPSAGGYVPASADGVAVMARR